MMQQQDMLSRAERLPLMLRTLYEQYGYQRYSMGKFEPYDLYRENKDFLSSETVITFTDASGRLMALKPDVTMSIVKNTRPETRSQKLYYSENVFRMKPGSREYSEIRQIGLEYIGGRGAYAEAEVVRLALESLRSISEQHVLCLNHMGLISAALAACGAAGELREAALAALRQKNVPALRALAERGLSPAAAERLAALAMLSGRPQDELPALVRDLPEAAQPLDELSQLVGTLERCGCGEQLRLDLSTVGHMDYYNGLIFRGYLQGVPRAVLSGGRYDNLMLRFGKPLPALGFALYPDELSRALHMPRDYDVDVLVLFGDAAPELVLRACDTLRQQGFSVRAEQEPPPGLRARRCLRLLVDGGWEEIADA